MTTWGDIPKGGQDAVKRGSVRFWLGMLLWVWAPLAGWSQNADTLELPLPHGNDVPNPVETPGGVSLGYPDVIQYGVDYDESTGQYIVRQRLGDTLNFRNPTFLTLDEFLEYNIDENISEFWTEMQQEVDDEERGFAPKLTVDSEIFETIFGSNEIEIRPQGSAELNFGVRYSRTENPRLAERDRAITTFDFDQRIQLSIDGSIGDKINLGTNYNTEATFDFENQMNIGFQGEEDDILKNIEAGNITMPLQSTLIQGSQSLFGTKLETQWGKVYNTTVFSQQKGERKEIEIEGGAQTQEFDIRADDYEANRHYFLSQYFRDQYDNALRSLPVVNSGARITRIEVYVVNTQANTQDVRNILAFTDIGEHPDYISTDLPIGELTDSPDLGITLNRAPNNANNEIFLDMTGDPNVMGFSGSGAAIAAYTGPDGSPIYDQGIHYERVGNARRLAQTEFTYNDRLGFISLRQSLNNAEVLAVAYEYTLDGETYQVGTLSQDGYAAPGALVLKMLKSSVTRVSLENGDVAPLWDLMMKNVYSLGAFGLSSEDFRIGIWYNDPATGVDLNYIPRDPLDGEMLIQVLGMDRIDVNGQLQPDGVYDFVDNAATQGGTMNSQNGRVFLPSVEPFGKSLRDQIEARVTDPDQAQSLIQTIVFQPLYDSTKTAAQQIPSLNRFRIKGQYQSQVSSEIMLNALNIPEGSVTVTSGGVRLIENQDYTVDYNLGRVRIINDGLLESGQPIRVSLESNSLFNIQTKTMIGTRFDYAPSEELAMGATFLNLRERPLTQKVNIGDEPVNNTIMGADFTYSRSSQFLTDLIDKLPLIKASSPSSINLSAEAAYLIPGHSRAVGKEGNAYIDDFEGSQSAIDIRSWTQWSLASTPKLQPNLFPEGDVEDSLFFNYNRARLNWYTIDPSFFGGGLQDGEVDLDVRSNHLMRLVENKEVFPNRQLPLGTPENLPTFDLTFDPSVRGPYNYLPAEGIGPVPGLNPDGSLQAPEERWGGIQRALLTTDFELSNVEYIQFWVMDPFNEDSPNDTGGDLYMNLGSVSEDLLNDGQLAFENGLPSANQPAPTVESTWGVVADPSTFNVVNAFDNSTGDYSQQDVGLDGLNSDEEQVFFSDWLDGLQNALEPDAYDAIRQDPSADDFRYFRDPEAQANEEDVLERYRFFNGYEGNSSTAQPAGYPIASTTLPNTEDLNEDLTLSSIESYFQYRIPLRPGQLNETNIGRNYLSDVLVADKTMPNGETRQVKWFQFKVPIRDFEARIGGISDFRSIRFMRIFMKGWRQPVTLRFARLELIRGEWRKFEQSLAGPQEIEPDDPSDTQFAISAVNIEENGYRQPINYVTPPGIIREINVATANQAQLNEQSLQLEVCGLEDGDARAAYRNINFDMRMYKRLRMFVHAEQARSDEPLETGDLTAFIRLGSDFVDNYYEYEIPLQVTPWGTSEETEIWPQANEIDLRFQDLQTLKVSRPVGYPLFQEFERIEGAERYVVKGNPNLANVVTVMIGIRNSDKDEGPFGYDDDGLEKCAVVWANELRLADFNEEGGWAATAQLQATLSDLGNLNVAANMSTPGWGGLEQRVQERQRETIQGVDANTTLQLGKFLPDFLGVQLPMYLGYSETVSTPQFDPLSPDVEIADAGLSTERQKKSQQINRIRSINFSNIKIDPQLGGRDKKDKKDKKKSGKETEEETAKRLAGADDVTKERELMAQRGAAGKPSGGGGKNSGGPLAFLDPGNLSANFAYTENYQRDINTEFNIRRNYRGGIRYDFTNRPKEVKPFAWLGRGKAIRWLTDFNFYTGLKQVSVNMSMDKTYEANRIRNNTADLLGVETAVLVNTQVLKQWNWNRDYVVKWDLTKSLRLDYNGRATALVGEPAGVIDRNDAEGYARYRDTVLTNIQNFGEVTTYDHNISASYKLPLDKLPLLDFTSADVRYQSTYRWDRAPFSQDSLGHTIQNSRNITLNAQASLKTLYDKVPFLKDISSGKRKRDFMKEKEKRKKEIENEDRDGFGNYEDDEKPPLYIDPLSFVLKAMMSVKSLNMSYSRNEGILLPGLAVDRKARYAGFDETFESPGLPFLLGHQNTDLQGNRTGDYAVEAANNGWLTASPYQNQTYQENYTSNLNLRAQVEPIDDLKIDLDASRTESRNQQSFFRFDDAIGDWQFESPQDGGNFTSTIMTWGTAFVEDDETFDSDTWRQFKLNRLDMSERLNAANYNLPDSEPTGYYSGWGPTNPAVTIPAFIAAYTGEETDKVSLDPFKTALAPNWRVSYDGLSKGNLLKNRVKRFTLNHSYRSTMTTSYVTNLSYQQNDLGLPSGTDVVGNWINERQYNQITISEQMSPLIGVDMTLKAKGKNEPQIKVEMRRDRTINFGLTNNQITETKSSALVIGTGYRIANVPNPFLRTRGKLPIQMLKETDVVLRLDITVRDNATIIRKLDPLAAVQGGAGGVDNRENQVTAGQKVASIKFSADLEVSRKLILQAFFDEQLTRPKVSTSFATTNVKSGIALRFNLTQ